MKKNFLIALVCIASAALFFACKENGGGGTDPSKIDPSTLDNTVKKCWEISYTVGSSTEVGYLWATEQECVATIQMESKMVGGVGKWTYKQNSAKDEASCDAQNPEEEGTACWQITVTNGFQSMVWYIWDTEDGAQRAIQTYEKTGWRGTYKKADAADKAACDKLEENPQNPDQPTDPKDYSEYDDTVEKCWEVTASFGVMSVTEYAWMTERQLVQAYDAAAGANYSYKLADAADKDACEALGDDDPDDPENPDNPDNPDDPDPEKPQGEKGCWLLSYTINGQTISAYQWMTEEEAKEATKDVGGFYEKADANDPDACEYLNADNPLLQGEVACWEITINYGIASQTMYMWGPEGSVKAMEEMFGEENVSHKKANAADEDACEKLNPEN